MARLIDADALIESGYDVTLDEVFPDWHELPESTKEAVCKHGQYLKRLINDQPTVDAVPVVRCCQCSKRYDADECPMCHLVEGEYNEYTADDGFCDRGERRTDGAKMDLEDE